MTTMVERVAMAMDAAADAYLKNWLKKCDEDDTLIPWIGMADVPMHVLARAAIQAMQKPTEDMVIAMESAASIGIGKPVDEEAIPRVWRYGIDAALNEKVAGND